MMLPLLVLVLVDLSADAEIAPSAMSDTRYLRALSLDLRGFVPTHDELRSVADGAATVDEFLNTWLDNSEFAYQTARFHRSLLWSNVEGTDLFGVEATLNSGSSGIFSIVNRSITYRGERVDCGDFEAELDDDGSPVFGSGNQEGWVMVAPYWDLENPIPVCALDAQERLVSSSGSDCDTEGGFSDPECGCGPNLQWCVNGDGSDVEDAINEAFGRDVDLRVQRVLAEDRPYLELLTGDVAFVNGPISHYFRHQTGVPSGLRFDDLPLNPESLPEIPFEEDNIWQEVTLDPEHAGVLTSPAFLLRFQTNRARANRFTNSFLCDQFQTPPGGLPPAGDAQQTSDVTQREGCKYCHAVLEPRSAYWGRWTEMGGGYLPEDTHPAFDASCELCGLEGIDCDQTCALYYVVDPQDSEEFAYLGWLNAYRFLDDHYWDRIDGGPEQFVVEKVADGSLPTCLATQVAEHYLGRSVVDEDWVATLASVFVSSNYDYKSLVYEVVTSDHYRRVP